ncbi:MAG: acylneuraminate cytidylyltransferase family protein [Candidatus Omnitrophica bacterium]|nr:acylneuraminate cytidylyltransferase family protein [Candidatus Omnitrophota bacterium]
MYKGKKILALIPARGGSKGLPRKNIRDLGGKPLIAWTIEQAMKSEYADKVVVSTDDREIADISVQCGAEVPFIRPRKLASDTAKASDVILHALGHFKKKGVSFDFIALLEPTSPLRRDEDIDNGIKELIGKPGMDNLMTLGEIHLEHPCLAKKISSGRMLPYSGLKAVYRRQDRGKAYFPYGVLYLAKVGPFCRARTFDTARTIPLFIERWQNYEVDDEWDLAIIEEIMKKRGTH